MQKFSYYLFLMFTLTLAAHSQEEDEGGFSQSLNDPKAWIITNNSAVTPWTGQYDPHITVKAIGVDSFIQWIDIDCTPPVITTGFSIRFGPLESYPSLLRQKYNQLVERLEQICPKIRNTNQGIYFDAEMDTIRYEDIFATLYYGEVLSDYVFDIIYCELKKCGFFKNDFRKTDLQITESLMSKLNNPNQPQEFKTITIKELLNLKDSTKREMLAWSVVHRWFNTSGIFPREEVAKIAELITNKDFEYYPLSQVFLIALRNGFDKNLLTIEQHQKLIEDACNERIKTLLADSNIDRTRKELNLLSAYFAFGDKHSQFLNLFSDVESSFSSIFLSLLSIIKRQQWELNQYKQGQKTEDK